MTGARPALLADLGGTNVRFALAGPDGGELRPRAMRGDDHPDMAAAVEAYLAWAAPDPPPAIGAFAVASPVTGDRIDMTNRDWSFSVAELRRRLGFERLEVVNDFTAVALSVPRLGPGDLVAVGGGAPAPGAPIGVIGPGTGLGVSGLVPALGRLVALSTEGGHVTMAAATARESAVLADLAGRFDHVSAERVLSGQGLVNLYEAISRLAGTPVEPLEPHEITGRGLAGSSAECREALDMFCAMLGTAAGNLALTLGARAGIYIAGGIVPRLGEYFARSRFRERFEAKGRFTAYMSAIPVRVVTREVPAFIGLAALLEDDAPGIPVAAREA